MTVLGPGLVALGAAVAALGGARVRGPWRRLRALRASDENAARYRAWRGGPGTAADETSGASVAMAMLRREVRTWAVVAAAGAGLVVAGLVLAAG